MWSANEIVQGDSGLVVSNKLDAEFQRIQTKNQEVDTRLADLVYTNLTTMWDAGADKLIVSPYTFWNIINPLKARVVDIEKTNKHFREEMFDGTFWLRTDVMMEYSGPYIPYRFLADGYFITRSHLDEQLFLIEDMYMPIDGSESLPNNYVPTQDYSIATKIYVDESIADARKAAGSDYIEFPRLTVGNTRFDADIGSKNFIVYLNGIMQRRIKFAFDQVSITFHTPLDIGDEVTIAILGE